MAEYLYTTGNGYEEIRPPGREGASEGIKHHRLLAYAWGKIDSLDDPQEIDHQNCCRWANMEGNLEPESPEDHARITRRRERERKAQAQNRTLDAFAEEDDMNESQALALDASTADNTDAQIEGSAQ